ncbi:MAG: hypothetical protein HYZ75_01445 [Elusimicrobia bacterium]|nr:hypothetical protein [Elusimicrobiota bacterium]
MRRAVQKDGKLCGQKAAWDRAQYMKDVGDVFAGKKDPGRPLYLGPTPVVLQFVGAKDYPVVMPASVVTKAREKHSVGMEILTRVPDFLADPLMVFRSDTEPNALVVLAEIESAGRPVVAALHLERKQYSIDVNRVASVHAKDTLGQIQDYIDEDLTLYWDEEKAKAWLSHRKLNAPGQAKPSTDTILSKADFVKAQPTGVIPKYDENLLLEMMDDEARGLGSGVVREASAFASGGFWMRGAAAALLLLSACGPKADYGHAVRVEATGDPLKAVAAWEAFLKAHPLDERGPEAAYRVASLYAVALGRCEEARPLFEAAARSSGPWTEPAKLGVMSCPDYFPLAAGARWTFVDTLSGGQNMRLETKVVVATGTSAGLVKGQFYAGDQAFRDYRRRYEKADWSVWEEDEGVRSPILRWPYNKGRTWTAEKAQGSVTYTIESAAASVKVKAGSYSGCLKVRSQAAGYDASWVYDYYCPGVGRVKTTVGVPGAENPNTELAEFRP